MFHRFLILLVISWQVASQLAAVPHAHAGPTSDEHHGMGDAPHLHFPMWSDRSCRDDSHHDDSHHDHAHHDESHREHSHHEHPQDAPSHDCGVIFVEAHDGVVASKVSFERSALAVWTLPLTLHVVVVPPVFSADSVRTGHPLDDVGDGSDVYLTLRKLLI